MAIGHFNVSDKLALEGIFGAAIEISKARGKEVPVIIGVSEGEAGFVGYRQIAELVGHLRDGFNYPIFLNADHTKSLDKIKQAVEAGFDAVLFDAGKLPLEENIEKTKEVVKYVRKVSSMWRKKILVEAELGYLGSGSVILKDIPEGATVNKKDLTKPEDAERFVKETGIDLLAPAVGNLHGMFKNSPNPNLDIKRIKEIRERGGVPLVLHGGSGIRDKEFIKAIDAGISTIHINTEVRMAWRNGFEKAFHENPDEVVPYKIMPVVIDEVKNVVKKRLELFNKIK